MRKTETRGDCPVCGYPKAYTETITREGKRLGWCASCQDKEAIAAFLRDPEQPGRRVDPAAILQDRAERAAKAKERARIIWDGAGSGSDHNGAGKYLTRRGLAVQIHNASLRWRTDCMHPDGKRYPAMVARIQNVHGEFQGVHRTFLTMEGSKADLDPQKASLGTVWGCAIWFPRPGKTTSWREIVVAEGIESALSAGLLLDLPAMAAISAGNLASGMMLPDTTKIVMIAADHDKPGIVAAETATARWAAEGRMVRIMKPAIPGHDFNDVLMGKTA